MKLETKTIGPVEAVFDTRTRQCKFVLLTLLDSETVSELHTSPEGAVWFCAQLKTALAGRLSSKAIESRICGTPFDSPNFPSVEVDPLKPSHIVVGNESWKFLLENHRALLLINALEESLSYSGTHFSDLYSKALEIADSDFRPRNN